MSEKVRYFLELLVPELEDLQQKRLFDKNEITLIMKRRTDFEHRVLSRGCKSLDYARYIEYEKNLEKLRVKRYNRLKLVGLIEDKKTISDYSAVKRITFIYDRALDRYPKDMVMWNSYLIYAKKHCTNKVIYKIYTKVLLLHPTNVKFWINAANYEFEQHFNVRAARILFQRGLRFNSESVELWLSYVEFELLYVTKLLERRRVLGLLTEKQQKAAEESEVTKSMFDDDDDNLLRLPNEIDEETREQLNELPEAALSMLGNPETNPALRGDTALTIYDVGIKTLLKYKKDDEFHKSIERDYFIEYSKRFLSVFDQFENLNRANLAGHVINHMVAQYPHLLECILLDITLPIRYDDLETPELVDDLKLAINKFQAYKAKNSSIPLTAAFVTYLTDKYISVTKEESPAKQILQSIIEKIK